MGRLPYEFSGGQCQRISIARALVLNPEFIICDEPVSALDVSIRAQILNLLEEMKARYGLTLLFIAHDLAVVKAVSDRVAVMYLGRLCEVGPSEQLFARPAHPYTALLIEAIPQPDPDVRPSESVAIGEPPSPISPPSGCRFRTRLPEGRSALRRRDAGTGPDRARSTGGVPSSELLKTPRISRRCEDRTPKRSQPYARIRAAWIGGSAARPEDVLIIRQQVEARFDLVEIRRCKQRLGRPDRPVWLACEERVVAIERLCAFGDVGVADRDAELVVLPLVASPMKSMPASV